MTPDSQAPAPSDPASPVPGRRLRRAERREQILAAATRAFARSGFSATGLDDIASEAGVSHVILYRHFDSKADMYRAVLDRTRSRLAATVGTDNFAGDSIAALVRAASEDPDGFRLLFRHAAREPEFRDLTDTLTTSATAIAHRHLATAIPDEHWARWASQLVPAVVIEAIIAWLDSGQPDRDDVADRIGQAVRGVIRAAR